MMKDRRRSISALAIAVAVILASACVDAPAPEPPAVETAGPPTLTLAAPVHHVSELAREPMVVEHPDGTLFVAGYGSQVTGTDPRATPLLWSSVDGGSSWSRVDAGTAADGAMGNSDTDLAIGPDGTLYFLTMGFDRGVREGTHVAIGVSSDVGASWTWSLLSETRFDDRPWVAVAPDGTAHVIWNDDAGVSHAVSRDGGLNWVERERIHPEGGSSHLAVGPNGEIAVRLTPIAASANRFHAGVDLIAVSLDGGDSWTKSPAPGERVWGVPSADSSILPRWVEPLAWGPEGALYYLWSEGETVRLARSLDFGASWSIWPVSTDPAPAFFPFLTSGETGELAATWFRRGDELTANVALILVPREADQELDVLLADPFQPDSWLETLDERTLDPAGEYLPVVILADGDLGVASPIQDAHGGRFGFSWWRVQVR